MTQRDINQEHNPKEILHHTCDQTQERSQPNPDERSFCWFACLTGAHKEGDTLKSYLIFFLKCQKVEAAPESLKRARFQARSEIFARWALILSPIVHKRGGICFTAPTLEAPATRAGVCAGRWKNGQAIPDFCLLLH